MSEDPNAIAAAERITAQLNAYGNNARSKLGRAILKGAHKIERAAKKNAPVDTGYLRASITTVYDAEKQEARVGTNTHYAPYVEYGTKRQPANPYLRTAFEENKDAVTAEIAAALKEG